MVDVVVVGNIDRYPLVFTREMVDVVVVGNITIYITNHNINHFSGEN
jgi:hypothetical protein